METTQKKTYIVKGLSEWTARIMVGRTAFIVPFTGGAATKYGNIPAKYTTSNVAVQKIIEDSEQFKSGRISIMK